MEDPELQVFCPICKSELNNGASKCPYCGSYVKRLKRWALGFIRIIEIASLVAVVLTLYYLHKANEISQISLQENLARIDSTVALQRQALDVQMQQSKTEKASQLLREKEIFERDKPIIDISTPTVVQTDSGLDISFFARNRGTSKIRYSGIG